VGDLHVGMQGQVAFTKQFTKAGSAHMGGQIVDASAVPMPGEQRKARGRLGRLFPFMKSLARGEERSGEQVADI